MDSLLEQVVRSGTGAGIHSRGINFPVAGKTGTSDHDGWFAGFSSKLICVVWVGFDDNRPLNLEGAHSALPVWAEFMKRAHMHRQYRNATEFQPPSGIASVQIDPETGQLATAACPKVQTEYFIEGTQPVELCALHHGGGRVAAWEDTMQPAQRPSNSSQQSGPPTSSQQSPARNPNPAADPAHKPRGFLNRLRSIFK